MLIDWLFTDSRRVPAEHQAIERWTRAIERWTRANWYREFIRGGDKSTDWEVVVPVPVSSPFIVNRGETDGSGVVITRWTYQGAIALYRNFSRYRTNDREISHGELGFRGELRDQGRIVLQQAQMINTLEWEMSKMGRKTNWKILSVPL